jgi:hypothetical protein
VRTAYAMIDHLYSDHLYQEDFGVRILLEDSE